MATNQIMFGGNILPCTVERFPDIHKAQRKFRQYNIPGRNGDVFFQDDAYENVLQSYQIYAGDGTYGSQAPWTELARCLYLDGYQELRDTYDPDHFRKAVFNGPIDIENSWNTHGRATIEFNCRPERYLVDGRNPLHMSAESLDVQLVGYDYFSHWDAEEYWTDLGVTDTEFWVLYVPLSENADIVRFKTINDGQVKHIFYADSADRPEEQYSFTASDRTPTITLDVSIFKTSQPPTGFNVVIPSSYIDGRPVFYINGEHAYGAYELNNAHMPSYPNITLHNIAAHSGEEMVFQLNDKTVYIDYQSDTPYYFIDTENFSVTCAASLDGERMPATNVYMSADMKLLSGQNSIFTTEWYDATIVPNWWEL